MNPLDYTGTEFLWFYVQTIFWLTVGRGVIQLQRALGDKPELGAEGDLRPYELAWLTGGSAGVAGAVIVALNHAKLVGFERGLAMFLREQSHAERVDSTLEPLERDVLGRLRHSGGMTQEQIEEVLERPSREIAERMRHQRFASSHTVRALSLLFGGYGWGALVALGVIKAGVGITRGKPIGFLLVLLSVSALVAWATRRPLRLTKAGVKAIDYQRSESIALKDTAPTAPAQLSHGEAVMAYALFGTMAVGPGLGGLWAPSFEAYHLVSKGSPWFGNGGGGSCSVSTCGSSCGSSCGGGCGGGCGGCGG